MNLMGGKKAFTSWVFTIAKNLLLNSNRKAMRRDTKPMETLTLINEETWDDEWQNVKAILDLLPKEMREIIILIDLLGFSSGEAASFLGLSTVNVRVRRSRILKKLKVELEAHNKNIASE